MNRFNINIIDMKIFKKLARYRDWPIISTRHYTFSLFKSPRPSISKRICYNYQPSDKHQFNLIEVNEDFNYEEYINNLKSIQWVNYQIKRLGTLLTHTKNYNNEDFKHLRNSINQLLMLSKYITESRSYHSSLSVNLSEVFERLPVLLRMIFSEKSNKTHQNIYEQQKSTYQFIQISFYLQLCNNWKVPFDKEILQYYLHSYMNLLYDRNIFKYLSVYQVLKQSQVTQLTNDIIQQSKIGVIKLVQRFEDKIAKSHLLNPYQMAIYLKYIRSTLYSSLNQAQRAITLQVISTYLLQSRQDWEKSIFHCENITYCLYLLFQMEQNKGNLISQVYDKIQARIQKLALTNKHDRLLMYLTAFNSHQDKITCMKIDIWLSLIQFEEFVQKSLLSSFAHNAFKKIPSISIRFWRYKYICWLLDLFLNRLYLLHEIHKICSCLSTISLHSNEKISSIAIFLDEITNKNKENLNQIINIHESITKWLVSLPKASLQHQNPSDLCSILTIADRHPSLQQIHTPYLTVLLQLSLGHFLWVDLTKLYYYGLKFNVQLHSQQAKWNMEYVRRYILNQYATMGLLRRQIPEDSYFYKIIGITTPQKFYKDHIKDDK